MSKLDQSKFVKFEPTDEECDDILIVEKAKEILKKASFIVFSHGIVASDSLTVDFSYRGLRFREKGFGRKVGIFLLGGIDYRGIIQKNKLWKIQH